MDHPGLSTREKNSSRPKETLDLSYNALTTVPMTEITRFHHLRSLKLDNNNLEEIPWPQFMQITTLTELNLSYNRIKELPVVLADWNTIELLDVSHNQINTISGKLWPLFYNVYRIVPLVFSTTPTTNLDCPRASQALISYFGVNRLPERIFVRRLWVSIGSPPYPPVTIVDEVGNKLATLKYPVADSYGNNMQAGVAKVGKPYWTYNRMRNRLLLDGNKAADLLGESAREKRSVLAQWEMDFVHYFDANEKRQAEIRGEVSDSKESDEDEGEDDDSEDPKLSKKEKRSNTRNQRRKERNNTKAQHEGRDDKRGHP